jgi:hypothetical protein
LSVSTPISPDAPELRLIAQLASIKPSQLAAALNNPEHWRDHIAREQTFQIGEAFAKLRALSVRFGDAAELVQKLNDQKARSLRNGR